MRISVILVLLGIVVSSIAEADPEPVKGWKRNYFRRYGRFKGKGYPRRRVYVLRSYPYTYGGYGYGSGHYGNSGELYGGPPVYQPIHKGFHGHYGYSGYGGYGGYKGFSGIKGGYGDSLELGGLHGGLKGGVSGSYELKGFGSGYGKGFIGGGQLKGFGSGSNELNLFKGGFRGDSRKANKGFVSSYSSIGLHKAFGSGSSDSDERKGFSYGFNRKGASGDSGDSGEGFSGRYVVRGKEKSRESESSKEFHGSSEGKKKDSRESKSSKELQGSREGKKKESSDGRSSKDGSEDGIEQNRQESSGENQGPESKGFEGTLFRKEFSKSRGDVKDSNEKGEQTDKFASAERQDARSQNGKDAGSREKMKSGDQHQENREDKNSRSKSSAEKTESTREQTSKENGNSREQGKRSEEGRNSNSRSSSEELQSTREQSQIDFGSKEKESSKDHRHKSGEARNSKGRSKEKERNERYSGRTHGSNDESFDGERVSKEGKDGISNSREHKQFGKKFPNRGDLDEIKPRSEEIEKSETEKSGSSQSIESNRSKESKGSLLGGSIISIIKNFFAPKGSSRKSSTSRSSSSREGNKRNSEEEKHRADSKPRGKTSEESLRNFEARPVVSHERGSFKVIAEESDDRRRHRKGFTTSDEIKVTSSVLRGSDERKRSGGRIASSAGVIRNTAGIERSGEREISIGSFPLRADQNVGRRVFKDSYERGHFRGKSSESGEIKKIYKIINKSDEKQSRERIPQSVELKNIGRGFVKSEERKSSRDGIADSLERMNSGRGFVKSKELKSSSDRIADSLELKKIWGGGGRSDERERAEEGVAQRSHPWRGRSGFEDSDERQRPIEFNIPREEFLRFKGRLDDSDERKNSRGRISESFELKQRGAEFNGRKGFEDGDERQRPTGFNIPSKESQRFKGRLGDGDERNKSRGRIPVSSEAMKQNVKRLRSREGFPARVDPKGGRREPEYSDELVKSRSVFLQNDHPRGSSRRFEESGQRDQFHIGFPKSGEISDGFRSSDERKRFSGRSKGTSVDESRERYAVSDKRLRSGEGVPARVEPKGLRREPEYSDELVKSRSTSLQIDHPRESSRRFEERGQREQFHVGFSKSVEISDGFQSSDERKRFSGRSKGTSVHDSRERYDVSDERLRSGEGFPALIDQKGGRREDEYSDELVKSRSAFLQNDHQRGSSRRFEDSGHREQFGVDFSKSVENSDGFRSSDGRERHFGRSKESNFDKSRERYAVSDEQGNISGSRKGSDEHGVFRGKLVKSGEHLDFVGKLALKDGKIDLGLGSSQVREKKVSDGYLDSVEGKDDRKVFQKGIVKERYSSRSLEKDNNKRPVAFILGSVEDERVLGDYILNTEYSVITKKFADSNEREKFISDVLESVERKDDDEVNDSRGSLRNSKENQEKKRFTIRYKSSEEDRNIHRVNSHDIRNRGHSNSAQFTKTADVRSVESVESSRGFRRIMGDGVEIKRSFPSKVAGFDHSSEKGTLFYAKKGLGRPRDHESSY